MTLSRELQLGKAAEHLVCADLIMQGYNAFLADQGLPFDVVIVSSAGMAYRIQVKARSKPDTTEKNTKPHYRFGLRRARNSERIVSPSEIDCVAFVALDIRKIAYIPVDDLVSVSHGGIVSGVDLYADLPQGRRYPGGTVRALWGRTIGEFSRFPFEVE